MDTNMAINTEILAYLLEDSELNTIMGNSNISVGENIRSDKFPYISWSIKSAVDKLSGIVMDGVLTMHLWDKKDLTDRIHEMRGRLMKILDHETFQISGGEAKGVRLFYDSDILVPEDEEFIHHITILFTVRYVRSGDLNV